MKLRQVALVAAELAPVRTTLFQLLGLESDFADPGVGEFGLHNSVMAIGDTFLEVVSPKIAGTTAGRLLERRDGDGGYMVLAQVDDIEPVRQRTEALKIRKIWDIDRPEVKAFHVHPKDIGGAIVSFDQMIPSEDWLWGGPDWRNQRASNCEAIVACELQSVNHETLANHWARTFDCPISSGDEGIKMQMDHGTYITFVPALDGRGDGVSGVTFASRNQAAVRAAADKLGLTWQDDSVAVCGTRLTFRAA